MTTHAPRSSTTPGAVPARPSEIPPSGRVACLRTPVANSRVRAAEALGDPVRDRPDLALELFVEDERTTGDPCHELHRSIVVRRPEATGDEAEIGLEALLEGARESLDTVSDDGDPGRIETEPHCLGGEERPVPVLTVTAHELGARDDDRRPRTAQAVARVIL